jgi:hypothetical protein
MKILKNDVDTIRLQIKKQKSIFPKLVIGFWNFGN